jgi:hypothetical protein
MLRSALHSPKVLSRAETPIEIASNGAAWRSDEATGSKSCVDGCALKRGEEN